MIKSFKIKNFKSILELDVDFTYDEGKAPNGYLEMDTHPFFNIKGEKTRLVPCMVIYGANASGKTNIIKALNTFKELINYGLNDLYFPNMLNPKFNYTGFEIEVYIDNILYKYGIEYNIIINKEYLYKKNKLVYEIENKKVNYKNIKDDIYDEKKLQKIYEVECCDENKNQVKTFLHTISKSYTGLNNYITNFYNYITRKIKIIPSNNIPYPVGIDVLSTNEQIGNIDNAFNKIVELLKKFDIDIKNMKYHQEHIGNIKDINKNDILKYKELAVKNNEAYNPKILTYHNDINNNEIEFKFTDESLGTQTLTGLLGVILHALYEGCVLFIDELERSIHPLILREIVNLFKNKQYNKNNAQLLFTAHNTDILDNDILRVSEIAFVTKTLSKGSTLKKASSFKGIRNVTNFRKQYLDGSFSAIPFPYI